MMYTDAIQAANSLVSIVPLLGGNASRKDYEDALTLVEYLVEHEPDHPLVDMLVAKIAQYEDEAEEFAEFNDRIAALPSGVALLRVLMDQHKLTQSDFAAWPMPSLLPSHRPREKAAWRAYEHP